MNDKPKSPPSPSASVSPQMKAHLRDLREELQNIPLSLRGRVIEKLKAAARARQKARNGR